jgi:hypothetical protein
MPLDINGATISSVSSGIQMNPGITFNSSGYAYNTDLPGYTGWKDVSGNDTKYADTTGWRINTTCWSGGGLNTSTGVFTCPVAGYYAVGFNGIADGGSGHDDGGSYGYAGFAKNGSMSYYIHWNLAGTSTWNQGGGSFLFQCAANDTLTFFVNRSPTPLGSGQTYNRGWNAHGYHAIWCVLVG